MNVKKYAYNSKTQLTKNINVSELKEPSNHTHDILVDVDHINKVQDFMAYIGANWIRFSSGYRCSAHDKSKQVGGSGLRTIEYVSGRSMRLDSAIRMEIKGDLRELHNENQRLIGEEIGFDGWEISVHANPAPDHEQAQGRQFSIEEFEKLQNGDIATDYKGRTYTLDHDGKNGYRPISEMNCYHYVFSIILGVNKPEYDDKQLQQIVSDNHKGFEFEGRHYTMYEGTQLQRNLERQIREQKDIQI